MFEKIDQNSCNPDFMENAHSRLRDDCGILPGNIFAGYMSHTCYYEGQKRFPQCVLNGNEEITTTLLGVAETPIDIIAHSTNPEQVRVDLIINSTTVGTYDMDPDDDVYFVREERTNIGALIDIVVSDIQTEDVLVQSSEVLNVYRPGAWTSLRKITVIWSPITNEYLVEWSNF